MGALEAAQQFFEAAMSAAAAIFFIIGIYWLLSMVFKDTARPHKSASSFELLANDTGELPGNIELQSFDDIIGLEEEKAQLREFVDIFHHREKFTEQGVDVPRGLLLWGPPGCGKTSMAKAIAKEAGVNFICKNAGDLIEDQGFRMGPSNANENIDRLFIRARKLAPCIVFIDEIDIIGSRLGGMGKTSAIAKLLAEMDGFQKNDAILVIGATNSINSIDPALLRSGRFGKKFYISQPTDKETVLGIFNKYRGKVKYEPSVDDSRIFSMLCGCSPADIKDLCNEVGIKAVVEHRAISEKDIRKALAELNLGSKIKNKKTEEENKLTAAHECGHLIVALAMGQTVHEVSLFGAADMSGFTTIDPTSDADAILEEVGLSPIKPDRGIMTFKGYIKAIINLYGGVLGEMEYFGRDIFGVTNGASSDMRKVDSIITELTIQSFNIFEPNFKFRGHYIISRSSDIPTNLYEGEDSVQYKLALDCEKIARELIRKNNALFREFVDLLVEKAYVSNDDIEDILENKEVIKDFSSLHLEVLEGVLGN